MKRIAGSVIAATALVLTGCQEPTQPDVVDVAALASAASQVVGNQYIVVFTDQVADPVGAARGLSQAHGLGLRHTYTVALKGFAAVVPPGRLQALLNDPRVDYIEADLIAQAIGQTLPTGVERIGAALNITADIDGVDDRVDVDIAIIDTGIDLDHPDLNVFRNVNVINSRKSGDDDNGHGTHVAGTAAAIDNEIGVVGVAPGARLWAVKVLDRRGSGFFSDVIAGIDYVTANADTIEVANMSLGGTGRLESLRTAIHNSVAAGVVYVVAAGNSSKDIYGDGDFNTLGDNAIPASYPEVAAISAMGDTDGQAGGLGPNTSRGTPDDTFADFTNFSNSVVAGNPVTSSGAAIDLAAPGVDILSTWRGGGYRTISGTSMSSPHVAGAAALEAATNGRAINAAGVADIRQALIDAAEAQSDWGLENTNTNDPDANLEGLVNVASGPPPTLVSISVTPTSATIEAGQTQQFTATGSFDDQSTADLTSTATWARSNAAVASVDAFGLATGIVVGTTDITATRDGITSNTASLEVTAPPQPPTLLSISVTPTSATIEAGQTQQFTATGSFDDQSTADLTSTATWARSNAAVASVDAFGLATGIAVGTTDITATRDGITSNTASLEVTAATTTDIVTITKANYNSRKDELTVEATSDASTGAAGTSPTLQVTHFEDVLLATPIEMTYDGKKDKYSAKVNSLGSKPRTVTVTSSEGGSATSDVGGR